MATFQLGIPHYHALGKFTYELVVAYVFKFIEIIQHINNVHIIP